MKHIDEVIDAHVVWPINPGEDPIRVNDTLNNGAGKRELEISEFEIRELVGQAATLRGRS